MGWDCLGQNGYSKSKRLFQPLHRPTTTQVCRRSTKVHDQTPALPDVTIPPPAPTHPPLHAVPLPSQITTPPRPEPNRPNRQKPRHSVARSQHPETNPQPELPVPASTHPPPVIRPSPLVTPAPPLLRMLLQLR